MPSNHSSSIVIMKTGNFYLFFAMHFQLGKAATDFFSTYLFFFIHISLVPRQKSGELVYCAVCIRYVALLLRLKDKTLKKSHMIE